MSDQIKKDEVFRRFLDGELEGEEERKALHMIAEDEDMRELFRFERNLYQTAGQVMDSDSVSVPEGFTDHVMHEITGLETQKVQSENRIKKVLDQLITPRQFKLRPVMALAAVLILALLLTVPFQQQQQPEPEMIAEQNSADRPLQTVSDQEEDVWIRFVYFDDEAESMAVAGDFSEWEPIELNQERVDGITVWTGLISVPRGEQRYMFIKDGEEWVTDPLAELQRDDGFGNQNAVLIL